MILFICNIPWPILWLLPALLGLALGWALWAKYKGMVADLESKVNGLNNKISGLESDCKAHLHQIAELEGEVSLCKGKMREAESALMDCQSQLAKTKSQHSGGGKVDNIEDTVVKLASSSNSGSDNSSTTVSNQGKSDTSNSGSNTSEGTSSTAEIGTSEAGNLASSLAGGVVGSMSGSGGSTMGSNNGGASGTRSIYAKLQSDDLQIIEGIGPKMEEVLKNNGVDNWSKLADKSPIELRAILDKYGDKYKIIDVGTWSSQAKFAANGDFAGLIGYQKNISGGSTETLGGNDSKLEKNLIASGALKKFNQDDLKAIEGIGPKIEELLHNAGIKTWVQLSETSTPDIQKILDEAGARFQLADPGTWAKQALMCAEGRWDELATYQEFLLGGKE